MDGTDGGEEGIMPEYVPADYEEATAYIEELPKFTKKHSLDHTKEFLKRLGNPARNCKVIHVAGTNGKGSVCAYIQAILEAEGKRSGFFTSPHLVSVNERIQIDRVPVTDEVFYQVFCRAYRAAMEMEQEGLTHPSYFEFLYGMGMLAFEASRVEYVILETGLGGRLDATNSVEHPFLTVITSISLDHTDILGDTIEKIAKEKAGIIKRGVPVFFDGSSKEAAEVIRKTAKAKGAPCREISKNAFEILEVQGNCIAFSRKSAYDKDVIWHVPIRGIYQVMNAELALQAMEYAWQKEGLLADEAKWADAIPSIHWEGRMEEVADHLLVDGAHNPGAIEAFAESVRLLYQDEKDDPVVIFSAVSDKKYEQMIEYLCHHVPAKQYIVTEIEDERRVPAKELGQVFRRYTNRKVCVEKELKDAIETAFAVRGNSEIYCLGSLYLVGMVKKLLAGGSEHAEF